jgi:hypothetical protein
MKKTPEWEKEFDKLEVVYTIVNTESSVPLMLDDEQSAVIKAFIAKERATARAGGAQEEREKLKRITTTLFELYDKVDGSIKNLHTINQVVGDENRKELENNIRYLLGYISGLKIGLLGDVALTTKEINHAD